ncbi:GFA family protein [Aspergillus undulatus]|uniref:GFA family protein n=1 Tax=Aspergillus undulatus TaxID=1810928 RepID=UPI003CCDEF93
MATKTLTGACLCGKITYAIDLPSSEPNPKVTVCHCISCKRYTGSAFSTNIMVPVSALKYTSSTQPTVFMDNSADSGKPLPRAICANCATHFTSTPGDGTYTFLKWGTLDDEGRQACSEVGGEIYCKRRDDWVVKLGNEVWSRAEGMS